MLSADACVALLRAKNAELRQNGLTRYPCRSDFDDAAVVAIKAHLGPWPRALERAGLKPPRDDTHAERQKQRRIRAKRRRTAAKIAARTGAQKERTPVPGDEKGENLV